jgi:hypothetical protein
MITQGKGKLTKGGLNRKNKNVNTSGKKDSGARLA